MKINDLVPLIQVPENAKNVEFSGISNDSRKVKPGDLFVAIPGYKTNGLLYLNEASQHGACAALVEREAAIEIQKLTIPIIPVDNIRKVQGLTAAHFYGWPAHRLRVIGVTGTNGKTTVTHLIKHMLSKAGKEVGLIGTVWIDNGKTRERSERTTPDSIELQRVLAEMVNNEVHTVVMEVSSHALAQERVAGIDFDAAVITNVSHDHFDFHHNYDNYLTAKLSLFVGLDPGRKSQSYAVANQDDPSFEKIGQICRVPIVSYGSLESADTWIQKVERRGFVSRLQLKIFKEQGQITTRLPGSFNIFNVLAAATVGYQEGLSIEEIEQAVEEFPGVPGRYQEIDCGQPFRVMVDFAHNPAALENILKMAEENTGGRRIVVFGCEGEKDRLKRPIMGKIAADNSEIPILTTDNIYYEAVPQIFADVLHDLPPFLRSKILIEPDRAAAIHKAIELARPGDFVIVAGKGHEEVLVRGSEHLHFNDVEVVEEFLKGQTINATNRNIQ
ncbi:MAG TPA: UDP-N-acetylmuramoyl-L-alanyl-D-glutamate--2,6-diaminopimelate ligase [Firmicutes bacterium]|jgi:UDP-N-acetylmuramoyl-L-alanyl-D-glutamate--2,6-diaminopimelate ligase|nr:UDP-N-acetylmuramoyl-L-alanyl-D-glutamate--2,6-diaminopimelate ligase [Bacillota bacterium]